MGNVKLIAMDLDGTLITREGVASEANIRALQAASESGVVIATCSGRYPENASLVFLDHGLTGPIVGVNGAHAIGPWAMCCLCTRWIWRRPRKRMSA